MKKFCLLAALAAIVACSTTGVSLSVEENDMPAWRGEKKSLRACLVTDHDLEGVRLHAGELSCGSSRIPVEAQFLSMVMGDVLGPDYGQCGYRPKGQYDSLMVAEIIDIDKTRAVAAGEQQIWLTARVPADAEPGTYRGTFAVSAKGHGRVSVPVELEILPETLPAPSAWAFHLDLWQNPYSVARYHGVELWSEAHFEAMRPVMKMLADAGQKVVTATLLDRPWNGQTEDAFGSMVEKRRYSDGHWEYDFSIFDRWVEFMAEIGIDSQINCYSMIPWKAEYDYIDGESGEYRTVCAQPDSPEYAAYWGPFVAAFAKHLKEKGWFEMTMIAMDERGVDDMLCALGVIRSAEPEFKVSLAGDYHPELKYDIADYCIALREHFPEEVMAERAEAGMTSTYYTCCAEGHPNTFVVSDPEEAVWIGWHAVAQGYDGYLRWAYNSWTIDPLHDARFRTWPAGDCFMVYPEGRGSVHFEKLIEGIQDYEKARILVARWKEEGNEAALKALSDALSHFTLPELLSDGPSPALREAKSIINSR